MLLSLLITSDNSIYFVYEAKFDQEILSAFLEIVPNSLELLYFS